MVITRASRPADLPAQRTLWRLAFGDDGDYVDNFYQAYYRPERVLVLEEDGAIRAMTAWFDTVFSAPGQESSRAAYLYAVATHPDYRGRGLAAKLLADADAYFRTLGIPAVTTVPAEPSLHCFFRANGFQECFTHNQAVWKVRTTVLPTAAALQLKCLEPDAYGRLRETLLSGTAHVAFPTDALTYQAGCCRLSGGGLYGVETAGGPAALCAEGLENGRLMLKELLGSPEARDQVLASLYHLLPAFGGVYRTPGNTSLFGMLKWLDPDRAARWDWTTTAYLGLAFD